MATLAGKLGLLHDIVSAMNFDNYQLEASVYDEMFEAAGAPREHCRDLHEALDQLSAEQLSSIQERVTRSFSNEGISFTVYGDEEGGERIIPVDCLPRVLPGAEWRHLEKGLDQRIKALNLFLEDVYAEARIIDDGVIPVDVVRGCPQYRVEMRGFSAPQGVWVAICGTDLVRTNDGFKVLEDNLRVPSGVSYMIANRKAVKASLRRLYRSSRVQDVEQYGRLLWETLMELAPAGRSDPCIALLTPGVYNSAFYEHMFLAREIGAELVEGRDLLVNDGFVYMKTTTGLRRVDVIYRRVDDDFLDPLVFRPDSLLGTPGLLHAYKQGNVALVNAPGTGVADDKSVYAFVPDMIRYYLGEDPILGQRGDLSLPAAGGPGVHPRQPGKPGRETRWRLRRIWNVDWPPRHASRAGRLCRTNTARPGGFHLPARAGPLPGALPYRRRSGAEARRPAALCPSRAGNPHGPRRLSAASPCAGEASS